MPVTQSVKRDLLARRTFEKAVIAALQVICDDGGNIRDAPGAIEHLVWELTNEISSVDSDNIRLTPRVRLNKAVLKSTYFA